MFCPTCKKEVSIIKEETDEFGKIISYFSCGHRHFQIHFVDTIKISDVVVIKKKGQKKISKKHKFDYEVLIGERVGQDGKLVFIHQIIDRVRNYYKKFVKLKQGDKIIKDIEGNLTNHQSSNSLKEK